MRRILFSLISLTLLATACGDDSAGSAASWCDRAQDVENLSDRLDTDTPSATDYRAFRDAVDDVKGSAPSEISDAVNTMAEFMGKMVDALEDNDDDFFAAVSEVEQEVDLEEMGAAGDAIDEYNARECGIGTSDSDDSNPGGDSDDSDPFGGDDPFDDSDDDSDGFGDTDVSDAVVNGIASSLGLTNDQARCIVDELGLDSSGQPDLSGMFDVLGACDISVSDLAE